VTRAGTPPPETLVETLRAQLPQGARDALDRILRAGGTSAVYAAGGSVRDLLLGRHAIDLDLVVEGDAPSIAREALQGARVTTHVRFGTATATVSGVRFDLVRARRESYPRPAALPRVAPGSIADDLRRRDFTVNAMALRLDGTPVLLDPCGGLADLDARLIRVLHDRSFIDDPTRIYRAFRYAARLDFTVEPETATLIRDALRYVDALSGDRLRREIELLLGDAPAGRALEAAQAAGALQAAHPALHWSPEKSRAYVADVVAEGEREAYGFGLLASTASIDEAELVVERLRLRRAESATVTGVAALRGVTQMLQRPEVRPSGVAMLLDRYPAPAIAAYAMTTGSGVARELALRYLSAWRGQRARLRGRDLIAMGVPPGPQVERGLQLVRAARLDGWANDLEDERALIARFARSIHDASVANAPLEFEPRGE